MAELAAVPKQPRTPAVLRRTERRAAGQAELARQSARKRRTSYGGAGDWQAIRRQVFARDGYRCCLCGQRATDPHHCRSVGSGGRSVLDNLISLCRLCHAAVHDGHIPRERLYDALSTRYGYSYE